MRRWPLLLAAAAAFALETAVLRRWSVPLDLTLLVAAFAGFLMGPEWGAGLGFAGGLAWGLLSGGLTGLPAGAATVAGWCCGVVSPRFYRESPVMHAGVGALATIAFEASGLLFAWLFADAGFHSSWKVFGAHLLANSAAAPAVFLALGRATDTL